MDKKLTELQINEFIELLGSDAPAPGGGSASALAGSVGAALCSMVANLTLGKEKYKEHEALAKELAEKASALQRQLLTAIDRDTEAFNGVTDVFKMPKATDEEKAARSAAMQSALKNATLVPFSMMELCLDALKLTRRAVGKSNTNAASDLGVSALTLKAAVQGAGLNVLINLGGMKDVDFNAMYKAKGEAILAEALPLADGIYADILASL